MKKILFVVMLMLGTLAVSAQRWSLTPEAGMTAFKRNSYPKSEWRAGWKVGLGMEYQVNPDHFSLRSGVYYTPRGYNFVSGRIDTDQKSMGFLLGSVDRHFLQLPVLANFSIRLSDAVRLNLAAGPYFAFSMGDRHEASLYTYYIYGPENGYGYEGATTTKEWSHENSFDWGLSFQAGLEVHRWVMNVGYDVSLGKEWKGDSAGLNYQTVSLSVGYKFKLGK